MSDELPPGTDRIGSHIELAWIQYCNLREEHESATEDKRKLEAELLVLRERVRVARGKAMKLSSAQSDIFFRYFGEWLKLGWLK